MLLIIPEQLQIVITGHIVIAVFKATITCEPKTMLPIRNTTLHSIFIVIYIYMPVFI